MAPARSSTRRAAHPASASRSEAGQDLQNDGQSLSKQIFLDPSFGTPLQIYIEKDVEDKDLLSQLIQVCCCAIHLLPRLKFLNRNMEELSLLSIVALPTFLVRYTLLI
jgi:hypothetical protein